MTINMRNTPRSLRRFRPLTDVLEGLAPVSSLIPGLTATVPVPDLGPAQPGDSGDDAPAPMRPRVEQDAAPAVMRGPITADRPVAVTCGTTDGARTVPASFSTTVTAAPPSAGGSVTLATPATPSVAPIPTVTPPRPSSATLSQPRGVTPIPAPQPQPPSTQPAAPASAKAPVTVAADTSGIRLMSLIPQVQGQSATSTGPQQLGSGITPDDAQPPPPLISGLGRGQVNGPDLPVGAYATFLVISSQGWTIDPATIQWSNGTDYKSYFSDPATTTVSADPSLQKVSLTTGVAKNKAEYSFIVGAEQKQYTVTINCSYFNPNGGGDIAAPPTTVTFNSVRPTVDSIQGAGGFQAFYVTATEAILGYSANNEPWNDPNGQGQGNVMTAKTQTGEFGGDFMFLQLQNKHNAWTNSTGVSQHKSNVGGGANLDNGADGADNPIGMDLDVPPGPAGDGWSLPQSSVLTTTQVHDPPTFAVTRSAKYLTINTWSFSTYLMYMPTNGYISEGVWVALARLDWSFTGSATNAPPWPANSATAVSGGVASTPIDTAAFPNWTYDSSELTWQPGL
jgi:hypothetical protein